MKKHKIGKIILYIAIFTLVAVLIAEIGFLIHRHIKKDTPESTGKETIKVEEPELTITAERLELDDFINREVDEQDSELDAEVELDESLAYIFSLIETSAPEYYETVLEQVKEEYRDYETPSDILLAVNKAANDEERMNFLESLELEEIINRNKEALNKINESLNFKANEKIIEQIIFNELAKIRYIIEREAIKEEKSFEADMMIRILDHNISTREDKEYILLMDEYFYLIDKEEWLPTVRFWLYNDQITLSDIEIIDYEEIYKNIINSMLFLSLPEIRVILLESNSEIEQMDGKDVLFKATITMNGILYDAYLGINEETNKLTLFDIR